MANGQSWATSSTNWKSPNAFWRDSAEKRRRPRDGGEDARQGLRQQPVGSAAPEAEVRGLLAPAKATCLVQDMLRPDLPVTLELTVHSADA